MIRSPSYGIKLPLTTTFCSLLSFRKKRLLKATIFSLILFSPLMTSKASIHFRITNVKASVLSIWKLDKKSTVCLGSLHVKKHNTERRFCSVEMFCVLINLTTTASKILPINGWISFENLVNMATTNGPTFIAAESDTSKDSSLSRTFMISINLGSMARVSVLKIR
uniref:HRE165 protein n=1 Tax=Saccharomyces cerevisiae TaxID=4932 RepID=E9PAF0_YEASX|nr:HRE165 [Saccharomyces cerevisiae]prf//2210407G HRE165 gene [Saccharomyces cerevisiae]